MRVIKMSVYLLQFLYALFAVTMHTLCNTNVIMHTVLLHNYCTNTVFMHSSNIDVYSGTAQHISNCCIKPILPGYHIFVVVELRNNAKSSVAEHVRYLALFVGRNQSVTFTAMVKVTLAREALHHLAAYGGSLLYR